MQCDIIMERQLCLQALS